MSSTTVMEMSERRVPSRDPEGKQVFKQEAQISQSFQLVAMMFHETLWHPGGRQRIGQWLGRTSGTLLRLGFVILDQVKQIGQQNVRP